MSFEEIFILISYISLFLIVVGSLIAFFDWIDNKKRAKDVDIYEPYGYGKWRKVKR